LQEKYDDRNHKQDVDESTQRVGTDDSQQPQNQKDYKDCPKHALTSRGYAPYSTTSIDTTNHLTPDRGPPVVCTKKDLRYRLLMTIRSQDQQTNLQTYATNIRQAVCGHLWTNCARPRSFSHLTYSTDAADRSLDEMESCIR
jgi:hypothetical protein